MPDFSKQSLWEQEARAWYVHFDITLVSEPECLTLASSRTPECLSRSLNVVSFNMYFAYNLRLMGLRGLESVGSINSKR